MELLIPAAALVGAALVGALEAPFAMRSDVHRLSSLVESRERLRESSSVGLPAEASLDNAISVLAANIEARELESVVYKAYGKAEATRIADLTMSWVLRLLLWAGAIAFGAGAVAGLIAVAFGLEWSSVALAIALAGWLVVALAGSYQVLRELVQRWKWRRRFMRDRRKGLLVSLGLAEAEQGATQSAGKGT